MMPLGDEAVDAEVRQQVLAYAQADEKTEQCGLVYGHTVLHIPNVHSDPMHYFQMHSGALLAAYTDHGKPDAVWHSHPNGATEPSAADVEGAPPGVVYLIVAEGRVYPYLSGAD